jgi:hypothetical protein
MARIKEEREKEKANIASGVVFPVGNLSALANYSNYFDSAQKSSYLAF